MQEAVVLTATLRVVVQGNKYEITSAEVCSTQIQLTALSSLFHSNFFDSVVYNLSRTPMGTCVTALAGFKAIIRILLSVPIN